MLYSRMTNKKSDFLGRVVSISQLISAEQNQSND